MAALKSPDYVLLLNWGGARPAAVGPLADALNKRQEVALVEVYRGIRQVSARDLRIARLAVASLVDFEPSEDRFRDVPTDLPMLAGSFRDPARRVIVVVSPENRSVLEGPLSEMRGLLGYDPVFVLESERQLGALVDQCLSFLSTPAPQATQPPPQQKQGPPEMQAADAPTDPPAEPSAEPPVKPSAEPSAEPPATEGGVPVTRVAADIDTGEDLLDLRPDVDAFAAVMLSHGVVPLSIGLFGDWGSGKSFFMGQLQDRCGELAQAAAEAEERGEKSPWVSRVAQIRFNAWHYSEASLWASLVTHLFDELAQHLHEQGGRKQDIASIRSQLQGELKTSQEIQAEISRELELARAASTEARTRLAEQEAAAEAARKRVQRSEARRLMDMVKDDPRLREELGRALKELGVEEGEATVEKLGEVLRSVQTFSGRFQALLSTILQPENRRWVILGILLLLIGVPTLLGGLYWVLHYKVGEQPLVALIGAALVQTWITISAFLGMAHRNVSRLVAAVATVEQVRAYVVKRLEEDETPLPPELVAAREALSAAEAAESQANDRLTEAQSRVLEVERLLQEARAGHRFYNFIQERSSSEDYRKHLGLVALIRKDFQQLSQLLGDFGKTAEGQDRRQGVERIVLYIDDLDRCQPERVVEVLQAVHLLLAMPLFVVVVGVDSRWLQASLSQKYTGLLTTADHSPDHHTATPLDYLEKIFQIPYCLPAMRPQGFRRLVGALLSAEADTSSEATARGLQRMESVTVERPSAPVLDTPPPVPPARPLDDALLRITPAELLVMEAMHPCFRTPRATKRFVNVYRLLRAAASPAERQDLAQGGDACRAAMVLLALTVGDPQLGECALLALDDEHPSHVAGLRSLCEATNSVHRMRLDELLDDLERGGVLPSDLPLYRRWLPKIARYSFRPVLLDET